MTAYEINGKEYEVNYDLDNRIIKADVDSGSSSDVEYRYDAFGRRVIRKEGSTKTALIWWAKSECAEYKHSSGQASIQNDLFAHPTRLNAVIARAVEGSKSKLQWYHKNYLDHVYAVSDDDGDLLEHYRYTAFGEVTIYSPTGQLRNTTAIDNTILWNARKRDTVSGYYMYKFRHYSAELGRWLARYPIEESGGVNLYGFVGNDGVNRWDELGLKMVTFEASGEPWHCTFTLDLKFKQTDIGNQSGAVTYFEFYALTTKIKWKCDGGIGAHCLGGFTLKIDFKPYKLSLKPPLINNEYKRVVETVDFNEFTLFGPKEISLEDGSRGRLKLKPNAQASQRGGGRRYLVSLQSLVSPKMFGDMVLPNPIKDYDANEAASFDVTLEVIDKEGVVGSDSQTKTMDFYKRDYQHQNILDYDYY